MPEFDSTIQYRDIQNFPGYKIGSDGSVWTARKISGFGKTRHSVVTDRWKQMKPGRVKSGHRFIQLCPGQHFRYIHRLVLEAFVGPCPDGMEACHNDGNPTHNHISNLRWDTHKNNLADCVRHGTRNYGERNGISKLTEELVRKIRQEYAQGGITQASLGKKYGFAQMTISCLVRRVTWNHVP